MGKEEEYLCSSCGHRQRIKVGSGMTFERVRCNQCGTPKNIPRYRYQEIVEGSLEKCACGGSFSLLAPPRCVNCGAEDLTPTGEGLVIDYD